MIRAEICTPWTGDGSSDDNANRPLVADEYTIAKWTDSTGQDAVNLRPDPNLYCIIAEMEDAVLAAIEADDAYQVLWSEAI